MASIKTKIILFFFTICTFAQTNKKQDLFDTIVFRYDRSFYNKIAEDSVKVLYNKQIIKYNEADIFPYVKETAISLNYKLEDLYYYSIPIFRLFEDASEEFNCESNIENYIAFEEYNKFQLTLIRFKNEILCEIPIPNPIFERQRIRNPGLGNTVDSYTYNREYIQKFSAYPENYTSYYNKIIYNKDNNFFFEISGLYQVLFEIETKTDLLYANYYGDTFDVGLNNRMLANEFIRKHIGITKIKILASGNYDEIDKENLNLPIPCLAYHSNNKKVFLRVKR